MHATSQILRRVIELGGFTEDRDDVRIVYDVMGEEVGQLHDGGTCTLLYPDYDAESITVESAGFKMWLDRVTCFGDTVKAFIKLAASYGYTCSLSEFLATPTTHLPPGLQDAPDDLQAIARSLLAHWVEFYPDMDSLDN